MWLLLAFTSALLLGLYDVAKKQALRDNAVLPVLLLNTLFSSLLFLPTILSTAGGWGWFDATPLRCPAGDLHAHLLVVLKSCIVLSSWVFGYFGIKHLPLTIVGPINATRPVMTLVGAMLIFGERLNGYQWVGVVLAIGSLFLLSRSSRREGVDFRHDVWIYCIAAAAVLGAASGLYDKFITRRLDPVFVQSWYTFYQFWMMSAPEAYDALPLELGHSLHFAFSVGGRSLLSLCVERLRSDDFGRLDDPPRLGRRLVRIRRAALPRTQPARQGDRSGVDPRRYGLPLDRFAVERRSRRASQCVREAGASGCVA